MRLLLHDPAPCKDARISKDWQGQTLEEKTIRKLMDTRFHTAKALEETPEKVRENTTHRCRCTEFCLINRDTNASSFKAGAMSSS
jgi:hypothetical protein